MNERDGIDPVAPTTDRVDTAVARPRAGEVAMVRCFFSGALVPRSQAIQVRVGPGRKVWMKRDLCRDG